MPGSSPGMRRQSNAAGKGISSAAAITSSGCSHTQSNSTGAISAVNTPPSAPPAAITR